MRIAIHQPNFFPWFPIFQKISLADRFIIMENVQYQKNGLQNRFNIGEDWFTMSTKKGLDPIKDKNYLSPIKDWNRIKNKLPEYKKILDQFDEIISENLSVTNTMIIERICKIIKINIPIEKDFHSDLKSTERIIEICKKYNADEYISGISGKNYLDINLMNSNGIKVIFQKEIEMIKKPILEIINDGKYT